MQYYRACREIQKKLKTKFRPPVPTYSPDGTSRQDVNVVAALLTADVVNVSALVDCHVECVQLLHQLAVLLHQFRDRLLHLLERPLLFTHLLLMLLRNAHACAVSDQWCVASSNVVLETNVVVSRRLEDKNSLGFGLGLEKKSLGIGLGNFKTFR